MKRIVKHIVIDIINIWAADNKGGMDRICSAFLKKLIQI